MYRAGTASSGLTAEGRTVSVITLRGFFVGMLEVLGQEVKNLIHE